MKLYLRSIRHAATTVALVAVDTITNVALTVSEAVVVVGSTVANLLGGDR